VAHGKCWRGRGCARGCPPLTCCQLGNWTAPWRLACRQRRVSSAVWSSW
jgi:hypothetical protein